MDVYLFSIFFFLSVVLLLLFFFRKQLIIGVFTGIFFLLCGVLLWNGLSYVDYTSIVGVSGNYTVTDHYDVWKDDVATGFSDNEIVGSCFVLVGLFFLIICGVMIFKEDKVVDFGNESSTDGEEE